MIHYKKLTCVHYVKFHGVTVDSLVTQKQHIFIQSSDKLGIILHPGDPELAQEICWRGSFFSTSTHFLLGMLVLE